MAGEGPVVEDGIVHNEEQEYEPSLWRALCCYIGGLSEAREAAMKRMLEGYEEIASTFCPYDPSCPLFYLKFQLNGHEIDGLIDTGASQCIVNYSAARACELGDRIDGKDKPIFCGTGGDNKSKGVIRAAEIKVSERLMHANVAVFEDADLDEENFLVGMDFLLRYASGIDFKSRTLVFEGGTANLHTNEDVMIYSKLQSSDENVDTVADVEREEEREKKAVAKQRLKQYEATARILCPYDRYPQRFHLKFQLNGHDMIGLVDTGARRSCVSDSVVRACGIGHRVDSKYKRKFGSGGEVRSQGVILAAELKVSEKLVYANLHVFEDAALNNKFIFGMEFLLSYASFIDFKSRTLVFEGFTTKLLTTRDVKKAIDRGEIRKNGMYFGNAVHIPDEKAPQQE